MEFNVLIVEDDPRIAEIHQHFTEKVEGFKVVGIADNLADAEKMSEVLKPDLILLDYYFPEGFGTDVLWKIRGKRQATDIIMITAARETDTLQEAIRGGVFDYIVKPVIFPRFRQALERFREHRLRLTGDDSFRQQDVDHLLHPFKEQKGGQPDLPKGIDAITLKKVSAVFRKPHSEGLSAENVGSELGISRTTARRYLEYLNATGHLKAELVYGVVGRPERRYFSI